MEKLNLFFDKIKNFGFWQWLTGWWSIRPLSFDAYEEYRQLARGLEESRKEIAELRNSGVVRQSDLERLRSDGNLLAEKLKASEIDKGKLEAELSALRERVARYNQAEEGRNEEHRREVGKLTSQMERIERKETERAEKEKQEELRRFQALKDTWSKHQDSVKAALKSLCQAHTIAYVDKVPFGGSPDNAIMICGEYVILDAKSPSNDDLANFPLYVRTQAQAVKKYAKQDGVWRDVYFVVPSNAVHVIEEKSYTFPDYNVYVVTEHVLEPLLRALKKLEEYEFVNQLSPEDRDAVCRVIGKLVHVTKRRIDIDQYLTEEMLKVLKKCETDIPADLIEKVGEFEKAGVLNPPQEKRSKEIRTKDLESKNEKIKKSLPEAQQATQQIVFQVTEDNNA